MRGLPKLGGGLPGTPPNSHPLPGPITSVCFSKDGQCALAASLDSTLRLLDKETGELLGEYEPPPHGTAPPGGLWGGPLASPHHCFTPPIPPQVHGPPQHGVPAGLRAERAGHPRGQRLRGRTCLFLGSGGGERTCWGTGGPSRRFGGVLGGPPPPSSHTFLSCRARWRSAWRWAAAWCSPSPSTPPCPACSPPPRATSSSGARRPSSPRGTPPREPGVWVFFLGWGAPTLHSPSPLTRNKSAVQRNCSALLGARGAPSSSNKYKRWGGGKRQTVPERDRQCRGGTDGWSQGDPDRRTVGWGSRLPHSTPSGQGNRPVPSCFAHSGVRGAESGGTERGNPCRGTGASAPLKRGLGPPEVGVHPSLRGGAHTPPGDTPPPAQSPGVPEGKASALWANVSATSSGKTREASA